MRVAHFAQFAPHQCGLYHTTKDMVLAEREVGIDARFIDPDKVGTDGSFTTEKVDWAYQADILVRHTAIPTHLHNAGIPIVMALHGRPESSYLLGRQGNPVIEAVANKASDARYKAFVTFWPEYVGFWQNIAAKVSCVPATVDLTEFQPVAKPEGCNLLISDMWRDDVTPFNVLEAAVKFARKHGAVVNIAGLPDNGSVKQVLRGYKDVLGDLSGVTTKIKDFYDKSHILVTPHVIATRSIREALACGLKVVAGQGCRYTPFTANPMDVAGFARAIEQAWLCPAEPRVTAEREFSLVEAGRAARAIYRDILKVDNTTRKVMVDIGAHHGETVRRFYREMPDAREYEIYCFEPDTETFKVLDRQVGHIKNVTLNNACAGTFDGVTKFYRGRANGNEGGTTLPGKQTGGVDYQKPRTVEVVDFARWFESISGDYNIVKMNIEGGEYELMEYMLDRDMTGGIDKLFVQLHAHKFEHGPQRQKFQRIESRFWNESQCKCFFRNKGFYGFQSV